MNLVTVQHRTSYSYSGPVMLGAQEMMLRPRASPRLVILDARLYVSPKATIARGKDSFGNTLETATFKEAAQSLQIVSRFTVAHTPRSAEEIAAAVLHSPTMPILPKEIPALMAALERTSPDPDKTVSAWAARLASDTDGSHFDLVNEMSLRIRREHKYAARYSLGTQTPSDTLILGTGTCRDFAYLMVEAARSLGYPARFVSGYLYDETSDGADLVGGANTHAWAEVHLPGAGWVEFDPTNSLVGGRNLIQSSIVLEPSQTVPVHGSYTPVEPIDSASMDIDVSTACERRDMEAVMRMSRPRTAEPDEQAPGPRM